MKSTDFKRNHGLYGRIQIAQDIQNTKYKFVVTRNEQRPCCDFVCHIKELGFYSMTLKNVQNCILSTILSTIWRLDQKGKKNGGKEVMYEVFAVIQR